MKITSLLCHLLCITALHAQDGESALLLDKIISHPGSYSQVCDVMTVPEDIPYRAFDLTDFEGASFSKANQETITKNRDALVKSVRSRLLAIDFSRELQDPTEDLKPEENFDGSAFGCDPKSLNPLLLELIKKLQVTEALPELLAVEAKLVKGIARAKNDKLSPAPVVAGWFVGMMGTNNDDLTEAEQDRKINLFQARIAQRDLVMLMALLMREKAYEPYLKTSLEAAYAKGLRKNAKNYPAYKPGDSLPEEKYGRDFDLDPITRLLRHQGDFVSIPYSRESRDEVRAAAAKWIAEHP